jgi:hypothetical protein
MSVKNKGYTIKIRLFSRTDRFFGARSHFCPHGGIKCPRETVFEWTYRFNLRKGALFIQPDIQYVIIRVARDRSKTRSSSAARLV